MKLRAHHVGALAPLLALLGGALLGIARLPDRAPPPGPAARAPTHPGAEARPRREAADLSEIRFRHRFRVLFETPEGGTAVGGAPSGVRAEHAALIDKFAEEQFLIPEWVPIPRWQDLVPALLRGEGDLVAANLQIEDFRRHRIASSVPVQSVREVMITRRHDRVHPRERLSGREIALRARSTFWPRVHALRQAVPSITIRIIPDRLPREAVLERVASMHYDVAVLDVTGLELGAARWVDLRSETEFSSSGNLAFGMHPEATELKDALDDFLTREQLARRETTRLTGDFDGIKRRGVLRVLTRNNAGSYFIWRGRPLGFEYEFIGKFAKQHDLSLEMIVAESREQLLPSLLRGEADVVAAGLADTTARRATGIAFTRPYKQSYELVVTRAGDPIAGPADLEGRRVAIRRSSPIWALLERMRADGLGVKLEPAPENLETETIIERVASGQYDLTVADAYSVKVAMTWRDDVRAAFALEGPVPVAWAVRGQNPQLLSALNEFLDAEYKQTFYNILHARYFENPRTIRAHMAHRADNRLIGARLSPYDEIVRHYAEKYGFDWPLIVALMFRESRFDPEVVSWAGARGLMQVLPVTAKRFGVTDLEDPESSIAVGVRMLDWLYRQMETDLTVKDRTWFSLAAYNAGLGHLRDARRLARELDFDPNRWFDNVEAAMLLLSKPGYYRKARHGYVRGIEPVTYVREIRELYNAYRSMLQP